MLTLLLASQVSTGDAFHIVGLGKEEGSGLFTQITLQQPNVERELCINNARGLLVLHPDVLISPTKVADACNCDRKGALSERLKTFGVSVRHDCLRPHL